MISLLVLLVPVLVLFGGYQLLAGRNQPVEIDPAPAYAQANAAGLAVAAPEGLDAGWVPVSAQFDPRGSGGTLRVGYVSPAGEPVQVLYSTVAPEMLLPERLPDIGPPTGEVRIGGGSWQVFPPRAGERALVRMASDLTTIVVGGADQAELEHLAAHS